MTHQTTFESESLSAKRSGMPVPEMSGADPEAPLRPSARTAACRLLTWLMLTLSVGIGFFAVVALEIFVPSPDRPVGVIFASGTSDDDSLMLIVAAGGRPIRKEVSTFGGMRIWLALGDTADFPATVRRGGALFVVNPYAFGGCLLADRRLALRS